MFTRLPFIRLFMILSMVVFLGACSTTEDDTALSDSGMQEGINDGPLAEVYNQNLQGPAPGTQADLVVNVGDRVFFGYDRFDLTAEAQTTLDNQAAWLSRYPNLRVTVEGHCDERGTREYNLALGERRANSVKNYLAAKGVDAARITTISYGKERPAVPGSDETSWAQNRRGVTIVE
ncbi:MAG: peptidoglycan-associated lipoprotein Pal [Alphaproteobacteria bacterium]|nr:peptidoglycan-associated lipoprotein Pal [Alphaproteobacteria bacterium]